jgi:threonine/homoserine/homoserine lactone efflux protein
MELPIAFLAVSAAVIMSPGQDTALTVRNALLGGRGAGVATALGVAAGQACWTIAASVGLTAVLVASEPAFVALRLFGAAYLCYLGLRSLRDALRPGRAISSGSPADPSSLTSPRAWRQGLFSSLGNPKLAIFFASLLPPFVPPGPTALPAMLVLGSVFVAMTVCWLSAYSAVVAQARTMLGRSRVRRAFDGAMGVLLVAFGLRLATQDR